MNNKTPPHEPVIPQLNDMYKPEAKRSAETTYKSIIAREKEESKKRGYGIGVEYTEDDFDPRDYWRASFPTFGKLEKRKINMEKLRSKILAKTIKKHKPKPEPLENSKPKRYRRGRKVINTDTGEIYETIKEASAKSGIHNSMLYQKLTEVRDNDTNLRFYEEG